MKPVALDFITDPQLILNALEDSHVHGTVVGISASVLGSGVFLTAVENLIKAEKDPIVVLKGYDVTGYILERNKIKLSDIRAICPFNSKFKNPYLKEVVDDRFFA